jgi:hypothetical protein
VQRLGIHLAIWGSVLQLGIVVGFVMMFVQMGRAMSLLNPSEPFQLPEVATAIEISFRASSVGLGMIGYLVFDRKSFYQPHDS